MMNSFANHHGLIRPTDALLPLMFLIGAALDRTHAALTIYICLVTARLLGLSSPIALRAAFALQPSMRKVRGSVKVALMEQAVGAALALGLWALFFTDRRGIPLMLAAALMLNVENVFYEYLFAAGEAQSAELCRLLTAALTGAGLAVVAITGNLHALVVCAFISATVGGIIGISIGGSLKGKLNAQVFRTAPMAVLRDALYPACALALWGLLWLDLPSAAPVFGGLILYRLYQTPFRRSYRESEPMMVAFLFVLLAALTAFALTLIQPLARLVPPTVTRMTAASAVMLALSTVCAFALNGRIVRERD